MTHQEKKAWLGRYRDGHKQLERLKEQRARAKSFGEKITVGFGGQPGAGKIDRVQLSVDRVEQIDKEIAMLRVNMPRWECDARRALNTIKNPDYRRAMWYYYVECLSWVDTAELAGYGYRYLNKLQKKILKDMVL